VTTEMVRDKVHFASGDDDCAAWHYRGANGACVVMAGGFAVTKEAGTDKFAQRFQRAGFSVLAFDYRRIGESGGQPRLVLPVRDQIADWHAAISFASTLAEVEPGKIALWGFSASGGHVLRVAARNPAVAAVIAQTPNTDGLAAARNQARHQHVGAMLRFSGRGALDAIGGLAHRPPRLVPLAGAPGTVAVLTTPDAQDADRALNPNHEHPDWQQEVAARSALRLGWYSPGRAARQVQCPLLIVVCDQDQSALAEPAVLAAKRAPRGEIVRLAGGHYQPFLTGHDEAVDAELAFMRHHLLSGSSIEARVPVIAETPEPSQRSE
jgi:alpha-beta hydrolase superfamily lysophospholipase